MRFIKVARVGSRFENISARELYVRMNYEEPMFILTPDGRLMWVGQKTDWRHVVELVTGERPAIGGEAELGGLTQQAYDIRALEDAFSVPLVEDSAEAKADRRNEDSSETKADRREG